MQLGDLTRLQPMLSDSPCVELKSDSWMEFVALSMTVGVKHTRTWRHFTRTCQDFVFALDNIR